MDSIIIISPRNAVPDFSSNVINWMQSTFGEGSQPFFDFFSTCGGPYGWMLVVPLVFWLSGPAAGLRVGFPTAFAAIANTMLKWSLAHPRPYYITDHVQAMKATSGLGMPSGHAQGVAAQWGAIAYLMRRSWCVCLAIAFILFTGAARVYFGVHTPVQVAVGWALGLLTVVAVAWLETPIVAWCRRKSLTTQLAGSLGVTVALIAAGFVISLGLRGDFQPAPEWRSHWQATVDRLVDEGNEKQIEAKFELIEPADIIGMGCLFLGFALCGIWLLRIGEIRPTSTAERVANVLLGVPLLIMIAFVAVPQLKGLVAEPLLHAFLGLVLPSLVGIIIPGGTSRLFSGRD